MNVDISKLSSSRVVKFVDLLEELGYNIQVFKHFIIMELRHEEDDLGGSHGVGNCVVEFRAARQSQ